MSAPTVTDRTRCAARNHGTASAYCYGCRCTDAREARRIYMKRRNEGRLPPGMTTSVGTARRLRALAALGWSAPDIAARIGQKRKNILQLRNGRFDTITPAVAARIRKLYDELSGTPGTSTRTKNHAKNSGWAPPLLWEDVDIDDPAAQPADDNPAIDRRRRIDLAEVEFFTTGGMTLDDTAVRLGVPVGSIRVSQARARQRQVAA